MKIKIDNTLEQNIQDILDNNGNSLISAIMLAAHPVGSIYMSVNNTNPGTLFGGTWVAWGSGQVPVGVKTTDTDFATVEKTGGSKTASTSYTPAGTNTGTSVTLNAVELTHSGTSVTSHTYTPAGSVSKHSHGTASMSACIGSPWGNADALGFIAVGASGGDSTYSVPGSGGSSAHGHPARSHNTKIVGTTDEAQPTFTGTKATLSHTVTQPSKHSFTPTTKSITQPTFTGTTATLNVQQPYITCYMWKRTA